MPHDPHSMNAAQTADNCCNGHLLSSVMPLTSKYGSRIPLHLLAEFSACSASISRNEAACSEAAKHHSRR